MTVIAFYEKDYTRYVSGESMKQIMDYMLRKRLADKISMDMSWWYGIETIEAQNALILGNSVKFMLDRRTIEYEDFEIISLEYAE